VLPDCSRGAAERTHRDQLATQSLAIGVKEHQLVVTRAAESGSDAVRTPRVWALHKHLCPQTRVLVFHTAAHQSSTATCFAQV
jgi:hypothetical protein